MASASASPSPGPGIVTTPAPANRHAPTAVEAQRLQLARLLKDPAKPAYIPAPPKEKSLRPPREMMKNVQGSSAGAGSGEFHVYKSSRRREYERLKAMDETAQKEIAEREFEQKKRQWEEEAETKTAKNRAKRQKKKGKTKVEGDAPVGSSGRTDAGTPTVHDSGTTSFKKRRLVNGTEMVFRKPGEEDDGSEDDDEAEPGPNPGDSMQPGNTEIENAQEQPKVAVDTRKITIIEED